jgi:crotonobetainyl-CoA:carnitine CoA-transferase CaiB-like acyl-CoA transferase
MANAAGEDSTNGAGATRMALEGVKVVEAASMLAAPLAGMMLADHGAEVIKIEIPGRGDEMRHWGYHKDGKGLYWKLISRNKRLVTLDLRTDQGREAILELLGDTDVLIVNFRPGTLERWGLSSEILREAKPDLIVLRVSGFGQTGPKASYPGYGTLAEAMSGFASINGWPDRPPLLPPFGLADAITGMTAAFGVLAALRHRDATGEGQDVDVALYEGIMTILGSLIVDYDQGDVVATRTGNVTPFAAPRGTYPTADEKWIALAGSSQATAGRLFRAIGKPEWVEDERFITNRDRVANNDTIDEAIHAFSIQRTAKEVMEVLEAHEVPATEVMTVDAIVKDEHLRERGSLIEVDDPDFGTVTMQAPVPRLTASPGRVRFSGRWEMGHDNEEVLGAQAQSGDAPASAKEQL